MVGIHLWRPKDLIGIILISSSGCFVLSFLYRYAVQLFRNLTLRNCDIIRVSDADTFDDCSLLGLSLPRAWTMEPGQYVYLTLLTSKALSWAQRHPFVITWWDDDPTGTSSKTIYIMIESRKGWSRRIFRHAKSLQNFICWLDGPYGHHRGIFQHGCVLLFATGAGMFAILPFVKHLTDLAHNSATNTRRIKVVWYTDQKEAITHLHNWMQSLLDKSVLDKSVSCTCRGPKRHS